MFSVLPACYAHTLLGVVITLLYFYALMLLQTLDRCASTTSKASRLGYGQVLKQAAKANGVAAIALILTQWLRNPQLCMARPVCVVAQLFALAYLLRKAA